MDYSIDKKNCEYLRQQGRSKFETVRGTWLDLLLWGAPHRAKWLASQARGERNNRHIVDTTHISALRSYVAGFLEGNTSVTRPWYRHGSGDPERDNVAENKVYLSLLTQRTLKALSGSNFYHAAGTLYYDYGATGTGGYYIEELRTGLYFHNLLPGSYYVINDEFGEAQILIREFTLPVKALVDKYGRKLNGKFDWSNFSSAVKKLYEDGSYEVEVNVVQVVMPNDVYDKDMPFGGINRPWISVTYELGGLNGTGYAQIQTSSSDWVPDPNDKDKYLSVVGSKRKPFIITKSTNTFEYGEQCPMMDSLGAIKSLNKKAIGKDQALEHMLRPPVQGPASLKKSYISTTPNTFVPLDAQSVAAKQGLRTIFEINPAIGALIQDVGDLRQQVDKLFYADFLLYLSRNPKTRTARETDAIVQEQQLIIGPNLQSLNWTHNVPVFEFVTDYVLDTDPYMPEPPPDLEGTFLRPEFISIFAQAQRAADLPQIERYVFALQGLAQLNPSVLQKANLDKIADIYEDRLYLPAGINRPQDRVERMRQQVAMQQQQQAELESLVQKSAAAKNLGIKPNQGE